MTVTLRDSEAIEKLSKDGGPLFPIEVYLKEDTEPTIWVGASLRDWFAGIALQGILAGPASRSGVPMKEWFDAPAQAYKLADAMLCERAKSMGPE